MSRFLCRPKPLTTLALAVVLSITPDRARGQTNTFSNGTVFSAPVLNTFETLGRDMNGMRVEWTFADGLGTAFATWGDLGVQNGFSFAGVRSGGFEIALNANSSTSTVTWTLTNATGNRLQSVRFNGAPGRTLFDCGVGCPNPGTPGSSGGQSLQTINFGGYTGGVIGEFTNIVGIGGLAPVGDLFEQLTITFADLVSNNGYYNFRLDTDNSDFGVAPPSPVSPTTVPEPSTWAMMLVGLAAVGLRARRKAQGGPRSPSPTLDS
ncbi:MAG: PEP-CTERM sorting domain-containing protein [Gemmatimonadaceae bacterium]|nr:PEP-CTERM sorting domain-containing protein [Gemmatimonadaceae bacterium]